MIATAETTDDVQYWGRLVQLSMAMLPGVSYHLNLAVAGLTERYRRRILGHWVLTGGLLAFGLFWPTLLQAPRLYPWGLHMQYSAWGLVFAVAIAVALVEITVAYRLALELNDPRTAHHKKARAFMLGNMITAVAMVDFLPTFGLMIYPFGYVVISVMHAMTLYGSVRYRLIEITPEFAAEHILTEMADGLLVIDNRQRVQLVNPSAAESLGCGVHDLVGKGLDRVVLNSAVVAVLLADGSGEQIEEVSFLDTKGARKHLRMSASTILDQGGFPVAKAWVLHDVTNLRVMEEEKASLEESYRATQKLESLGVMASGVAHDFNNLLLGILGHAELANMRTGDTRAVKTHLSRIEDAAERASELTGQMLTYTGKGPTDPQPIHLNQLVTEMAGLMRAAISKKTVLQLDLVDDLPAIVGDPSQMGQVVLNLITNASEALGEDSGTVTLRTGVFSPDDSFRSWHDPAPPVRRPHVFLEVEDTGSGMDEVTMGKIFDPFFTTKFTGRGLGLATVMGIVRSHHGLTRVTTAPGRGTSFCVALPIAAEPQALPTNPPGRRDGWLGKGLALLADDESEVRTVVRSMLAGAGFEVIEAVDGREAVSRFRERSEQIDVIVLDQTMPALGGQEAYAEIRAVSPQVPVVFMSGYTDGDRGPLGPRTAFLRKPFRASMLADKLREAMKA